MTNQTPALLAHHAPWMRAAVMLSQSLYFSYPHPPPPPELESPVPAPLVQLKIRSRDGKTWYI